MHKPQPKISLLVQDHDKRRGKIAFYATEQAIDDVREFGEISRIENYIELHVSQRYDFDEVLAYMQNYG